MRKLILRNFLSPGDIVMLTAAVRDLHRSYPNQFATDVRTSCPELWDNNPHIVRLEEEDPDSHAIDCHYPLIDRCNKAPYHCLHGFIEFLNDHLQLNVKPTEFKGDIHISQEEKSWFSQVYELAGEDTPFWIVAGGGKYDVTIKWWQSERYQEVIDHFRGKIVFVQVGEQGHYHPKLDGVIDLRGKTNLRQLVRLIYHSQGVLCPVTCLMHLAAAIETKEGTRHRPCVVIAGGREPVHWEAYPHHQFIHTLGALRCCDQGGCWRSRTIPLGDGDERDKPEELCLDVVGDLPRCMSMITAAEVIRRIETYFNGGALSYVQPGQWKAADRAILSAAPNPVDSVKLSLRNARIALERFVKKIPSYPCHFQGRGIVICAGGIGLFTNAWVCINMLRRFGCSLPIQLWHLGKGDLDAKLQSLMAEINVECVDASEVRKEYPVRTLGESELKAYAILYSPFAEVLFLAANNVPVVNPDYLFETAEFRKTGAVFWPDRDRMIPSRFVWRICGLPSPGEEPEFEGGQMLANKETCWEALKLALWYNENSDFFYHHLHGEKETFQLAFRILNQAYAMPLKAMHPLEDTKCQHDFDGNRIFQHRTADKWTLSPNNKKIEDFWYEGECRSFLTRLRQICSRQHATNKSVEESTASLSAPCTARTLVPITQNRKDQQVSA